MLSKYRINAFLLIFLLEACAPTLPLIKKESDISKKLPPEYPNIKVEDKNDSQTKDEGENIKVYPWKYFFKDKQLKSLIAIALENNKELNILEQEVSIANNEILERKGEYMPKMSFSSLYDTEKVGKYTSQGISDETHEYDDGKKLPLPLQNQKIGLSTTWEIDIWKKLRNATKSAYYKYMASQEAKKFVITNLVFEISSKYYELMALDGQLSIVTNYIEILQRAQKLVTFQQQTARVTSLAVKRFEAEVFKNQSRLYEIRQNIFETENQLNVLLGRFPQKIERDSSHFLEFSPPLVTAGLPIELLDNRPDVRQSILQMEGAKLDVKVAKARFYPSLSIDANIGYESFNSNHLYKSPQSVFYNLGVNLTAPLLNRNAIKADYFSANNKQIQAIYNYEYTLLHAYSEVINQLSSIKNLNKTLSIKSKQVDALSSAAEISNLLFTNARVNYIESLMTQRDTLEVKVELVEIKKHQLISYANLYKALGGGWKKDTDIIK